MSDTFLEHVESYLRNGKPEPAMQAAQKHCETAGATRDTAVAIAKAAATVYRDLIAPPVHRFADAAADQLPSEVGPTVQKALQRLIRMTEEWEKKLWAVHTERLARELREWTRMRHIDAAAANAARLMALVPAEQRPKRAAYIGATLATVINNPREAGEVLQLLARKAGQFHLTTDDVQAMEDARTKRAQQMMGANIENIEREYISTLTQTIVDIKGLLPESNKMDEPDENVLRDVGDQFRSILRVPLWREEPDLLLDATMILVDFIPREVSTTGKLARVEARAYASLGFTAKKAVMLTFQDLGKNKFFTTIYKEWAKDYRETDAVRPIVEFMGALRTDAFNEFLNSLKGDKRAAPAVAQEVNKALGSIGGEEAAEQLMAELRTVLTKRNLDSSDLKQGERLVGSLAAIVKSPRTEPAERQRLREYLRSHVPEDISRLAVVTALQGFVYKHDELTAAQRQWAIRVLVRAIWAPDESTAMHKGGERQASELGFRQEYVDALEKLAAADINTLIRAAEPLTARYGAAFMAMADLLEKLRDPATLALLERMLTNTLLHDDSAQNIYQQEYYWDAATQERKPLKKDKVLPPLIHAIGMIGGPHSTEILRRYQDQVATGRVPPPTPEVANYMQKFMGADAFAANKAGSEMMEEMQAVSKEDLAGLLKALTSRYFLTSSSKRRAKKVAALTRLGQMGSIDAVETVASQLGDKDPMVVSAAITCLTEYALPSKPKALRDLTINTALDQLQHKDPAVRQGAIKLVKELGPNRKDVREKILGFVKTVERREVKEALAMALKTGGGGASPMEEIAHAAGGTGGEGDKKGPVGAMGQLEAKRDYLAARKAWIAGGKIGDPPPKPPGVD